MKNKQIDKELTDLQKIDKLTKNSQIDKKFTNQRIDNLTMN